MRTKYPLISIVTVVKNGDRHLEEAIKSVLNQSYNNIEYIVVDGGSTDGTLDIIRKYEDKISFWVSEPDGGIFDAMNKGIRKASGDFIGILNADDWYEPHFVEAVADKIDDVGPHIKEAVVYCDYYQYDEGFNPQVKTKKYSTMNYRTGMSISHQSMFIGQAVYGKIGHYNLEYRLASDYDLFLRMIRANAEFVKLDIHGVNVRIGGLSTVHLGESVRETSCVVKRHYGVLSKSYLTFLVTNRFPSLLGALKLLLFKYAGRDRTNRLRRAWRRLKPRPEIVSK
jgi:glycosyltransferase involved in cell wall biosynthesis